MRQIVLDTETTGLEVGQGHRVIEIGCVELVNRRRSGRHFHQYLQPDREIDSGAEQVHGISNEKLVGMPRFAEIADELLDFIRGAELVIHNAGFDVGFLDNEFRLAGRPAGSIQSHCSVLDTLDLARRLHPGQRNNLDALCRRYDIDNSGRDYHGALLDAQLLADLYLAMTGGQAALSLDVAPRDAVGRVADARLDRSGLRLVVKRASAAEIEAHERQLELLQKSCPQGALWRRDG
ncbi:MAG: DNA polymerase III subunit epsilon [Gammaproteobacteria bacterium]|nr:DNA polymerase III subunit epsilon [Gammaproteobacteria bacterium]